MNIYLIVFIYLFLNYASQNEDGSEVERTSRFSTTLPGVAHVPFLTAAVVQERRPLIVAVMSAAASGTSKAAHGDVAAKRKKGLGALATAYLVIYNVVMTAGYVAWFLVLMLLGGG